MASNVASSSPQLSQVQDQLFGAFIAHMRAHAYKLLQLGFEDDRLTYESVGDVFLCRHVDALAVIAAHDLQTVVERLCDWRVTEPMSSQVPEHSKLEPKLQHDLAITAEKRRQLVLDYLFASVLQVLLSSYGDAAAASASTRPRDLSSACVSKLTELCCDRLRATALDDDRASLKLRRRRNADSFACVLGQLSQSHCTFIVDVLTQDSIARIESDKGKWELCLLLRGLHFVRLSWADADRLRDMTKLLQRLCSLFSRAKKLELKHALCDALVCLLQPLASSMRKDSLDYTDLNTQLHALFQAGQSLAKKTKHFTPATSLCTAILRISPPDVFDMQNAALIEQQVKVVKEKSMRLSALENINRLFSSCIQRALNLGRPVREMVSHLSQALFLPAKKISVSFDPPSTTAMSSLSSFSSSSRVPFDAPSDGLSDLLALMIVTDTAFCSDTILPDLLSPSLHNADAYFVVFKALSIVAAARRDVSSAAAPPANRSSSGLSLETKHMHELTVSSRQSSSVLPLVRSLDAPEFFPKLAGVVVRAVSYSQQQSASCDVKEKNVWMRVTLHSLACMPEIISDVPSSDPNSTLLVCAAAHLLHPVLDLAQAARDALERTIRMRPSLRSAVMSACTSRMFSSLDGDPRTSCKLVETVADLVQLCCSEIEHARRVSSASRRSAVHVTASSSSSSSLPALASSAASAELSQLPPALVISIDTHEPAAFAALCSTQAAIRVAAWRLLQQLRSLHTLCHCSLACDGPMTMPVEARLCLADVLEASLPVVYSREAMGQWGSAVGIGVTSSFNGFAADAASVNSKLDAFTSSSGGSLLTMDSIIRNGNIDHQHVWLRIVGEFGKIIRSTCAASVSDGIFVCCSSRASAISQMFPSLSKPLSYLSSTSQSPAFSHYMLLEAAASAAAAKSAALSAAAAAGYSDAATTAKGAGNEGVGSDLASIFKKNDVDAQIAARDALALAMQWAVLAAAACGCSAPEKAPEKKWAPFGGDVATGVVAVGGAEVFVRDVVGHLRGDVDIVRCCAGAALAHCNSGVIDSLLSELKLSDERVWTEDKGAKSSKKKERDCIRFVSATLIRSLVDLVPARSLSDSPQLRGRLIEMAIVFHAILAPLSPQSTTLPLPVAPAVALAFASIIRALSATASPLPYPQSFTPGQRAAFFDSILPWCPRHLHFTETVPTSRQNPAVQLSFWKADDDALAAEKDEGVRAHMVQALAKLKRALHVHCSFALAWLMLGGGLEKEPECRFLSPNDPVPSRAWLMRALCDDDPAFESAAMLGLSNFIISDVDAGNQLHQHQLFSAIDSCVHSEGRLQERLAFVLCQGCCSNNFELPLDAHVFLTTFLIGASSVQLRRQGASLLQVLVLRLECISAVLSVSHPLYVFKAPSDGVRSVLLSVCTALAAEAPALTMQVFTRAVEMIPKCPSHATAARCIDSVAPWLANLSTFGDGGQPADDGIVRGVIDVLLLWTQQFGQHHSQAISTLWTQLGRTRVSAFVFKQLIADVQSRHDIRDVCLDAVHMITQEQPEATLNLMCEVASLQFWREESTHNVSSSSVAIFPSVITQCSTAHVLPCLPIILLRCLLAFDTPVPHIAHHARCCVSQLLFLFVMHAPHHVDSAIVADSLALSELMGSAAPIWTREHDAAGDDGRHDGTKVVAEITNRVVSCISAGHPTVSQDDSSPTLASRLADLALEWSLDCADRHIASRCFQIFRALALSCACDDIMRVLDLVGSVLGSTPSSPSSIAFAIEGVNTMLFMVQLLPVKKLVLLPQLFWGCVAMLHTPFVLLYDRALTLTLELVTRLNLEDAYTQQVLFATMPRTWDPPFKGIQPLIMRGLLSPVTQSLCRKALHAICNLPCAVIFDASPARILMNITGQLPWMLLNYDGSGGASPVALRLCVACEERGFTKLSKVFNRVSRGTYSSAEALLADLRRPLCETFLYDHITQMIVHVTQLLERGPDLHHRPALLILHAVMSQCELQGIDVAHPKGDRFFAVVAGLVSGNLCHEAVLVIDVAVRMGIKGALRSTVTGKAETRRISRFLFAGDVGKRSSRTFKAFSAVLDTCPVPVRAARRSSLMSHRRGSLNGTDIDAFLNDDALPPTADAAVDTTLAEARLMTLLKDMSVYKAAAAQLGEAKDGGAVDAEGGARQLALGSAEEEPSEGDAS